MAEYIDREVLCKILENWRNAHADVDDEHGCGLLEYVICEVDAQPAADVVPVVHGQKIEDGDIGCFWLCSLCGECLPYGANYCPNCGAKMDGGADDAVD